MGKGKRTTKKAPAHAEIPPSWGKTHWGIADVMQVPWYMSEDVKL